MDSSNGQWEAALKMGFFRPVVLTRLLGSILLLWAVLCVVTCLSNWSWATKSELDVSSIKDQLGLAYRYVPSASQTKDPDRWKEGFVLENGKPLLHENGAKEDIIKSGQGYSFSSKNLWFATSDGSDPHTNGRHYQIGLPHLFSPAMHHMAGLIWAWGMVLFLALVSREQMVAALRAVKKSPFWLSFILLAALRMVLVSHDEIVVAASDPREYVHLASLWYYKAPAYEFCRLPVYPLFIAVSGTTGLPLRMVIEWVQLSSYALLAGAFLRFGVAAGRFWQALRGWSCCLKLRTGTTIRSATTCISRSCWPRWPRGCFG